MLVALGYAGAVVGLAVVILIAVTVGLSAAASVAGAAALLCGLLLLVTGSPMRLVPGDVRRSGSSSAVRVFAFVFLLFAAYSFGVAFEWPSAEFSFVGYVVVAAAALGCGRLASFVAWRSVSRNPLHPEHGRRPYFLGGSVPATRLGIAAMSLGAVTLFVTVMLMGVFQSLPLVTIPLAAIAVTLGLVGFAHAWIRGPASRRVPVLGIVTGLVAIALTGFVASSEYPIEGIACTSPTSCLGVGGARSAFIVPVINGVRGPVESIPGAGTLHGVACPTPTRCVAVGSDAANTDGIVVTLDRIDLQQWTPSVVRHIAGIAYGVACPSVTVCVVVGSDGAVVITGGRLGSLQRTPPGVSLQAVACPRPDVCDAVGGIISDGEARWVPITAGVIGTIHRVNGSAWLDAIACPTASTCVAVGEADGLGAVVQITGGRAGTVQEVTAEIEALSISCPTTELCAVAGYATGGFGPAQALVALHQGRIGASRVLEGGTTSVAVICSTDKCLVTGTPRDDSVTSVSIP
jgi:hypothetical protein